MMDRAMEELHEGVENKGGERRGEEGKKDR